MERKVLKGSTPTLVGYARLLSDDLVEGRPSGTPQVKVRTPAQPDPEWQDAEVDTLNGVVDTAAAAGDTEIVVDLETTNTFNPDFDVQTAVDAVSDVLEGFGASEGDADTAAASVIVAGRTVADFQIACGSLGLSDEQVLDLVVAYEGVVLTTTTPDWVKGRRYLIDDNGNILVVESRVSGAGTLRVVDPLPEPVSVGATVSGYAVLIDVDAEATASTGEAAVEWSATVGDEDVVFVDLFRIVARIPKATLTVSKLLELEPAIRSLGLPADFAFRAAMKGAWEGRMQTVLENNGVFHEDVISDEALAPLHALACLLVLIQGDPRFAGPYMEQQEKRFLSLQGTTFNRVSYAEQGQTTSPLPRDPTAREDRGNSIRMRR